MNGKEEPTELQPPWCFTYLNGLWLKAKRLLWEEHATDEDRRDARGDVRDDEG